MQILLSFPHTNPFLIHSRIFSHYSRTQIRQLFTHTILLSYNHTNTSLNPTRISVYHYHTHFLVSFPHTKPSFIITCKFVFHCHTQTCFSFQHTFLFPNTIRLSFTHIIHLINLRKSLYYSLLQFLFHSITKISLYFTHINPFFHSISQIRLSFSDAIPSLIPTRKSFFLSLIQIPLVYSLTHSIPLFTYANPYIIHSHNPSQIQLRKSFFHFLTHIPALFTHVNPSLITTHKLLSYSLKQIPLSFAHSFNQLKKCDITFYSTSWCCFHFVSCSSFSMKELVDILLSFPLDYTTFVGSFMILLN